MSVLKISFRLLSGVIFLFAAALMLLGGDEIQFRLLEYYGVSYTAADIVLRVVAALFVFSGVTELIGMNKYRSLTVRVIAGVTAFFDVLSKLTWAPQHELVVFHQLPLVVAVLLVLLLWLGTGIAIKERQERGFKKYVFPLILVVSVGITFIRPIYIDDWKAPRLIEVEPVSRALDSLYVEHYGSDRNNEAFLTAFFTTNCPYCKSVAKKMGIAARRGELDNGVMIFKTDPEKVETFMQENNCNEVDYLIVDSEVFLFLTRGRFPALFYQNHEGTFLTRGSLALSPPLMRKVKRDSK